MATVVAAPCPSSHEVPREVWQPRRCWGGQEMGLSHPAPRPLCRGVSVSVSSRLQLWACPVIALVHVAWRVRP